MSDQPEFDFVAAERERHITEHFERLERLAAAEFSEENLCLAWVTESDGRAWVEWWHALPRYERERMLTLYRCERSGGGPLRPYRVYVPSREELAAHRGLVEYVAHGIREAAIDRKPMPFREPEHGTGAEKIYFRAVIAEAMRRENVVIIEAQPLTEKRHGKRNVD